MDLQIFFGKIGKSVNIFIEIFANVKNQPYLCSEFKSDNTTINTVKKNDKYH